MLHNNHETQHNNENKDCTNCQKPVIDTGSGIVHVGGGELTQKCQNCGWKGGQVGRFSQCPRCGDQTSLIDDHMAS